MKYNFEENKLKEHWVCVEDLQGGEFGLDDYSLEEWIEKVAEWVDSDETYEIFREMIIQCKKPQDFIDYVCDCWEIVIVKENEVEISYGVNVKPNDNSCFSRLNTFKTEEEAIKLLEMLKFNEMFSNVEVEAIYTYKGETTYNCLHCWDRQYEKDLPWWEKEQNGVGLMPTLYIIYVYRVIVWFEFVILYMCN